MVADWPHFKPLLCHVTSTYSSNLPKPCVCLQEIVEKVRTQGRSEEKSLGVRVSAW